MCSAWLLTRRQARRELRSGCRPVAPRWGRGPVAPVWKIPQFSAISLHFMQRPYKRCLSSQERSLETATVATISGLRTLRLLSRRVRSAPATQRAVLTWPCSHLRVLHTSSAVLNKIAHSGVPPPPLTQLQSRLVSWPLGCVVLGQAESIIGGLLPLVKLPHSVCCTQFHLPPGLLRLLLQHVCWRGVLERR